MEDKLNFYSFKLPHGNEERIFVFAENFDKAVDSVEQYYHTKFDKQYLKEYVKQASSKAMFDFLNGSVIGKNNMFLRTTKIEEEWAKFFAEGIDFV